MPSTLFVKLNKKVRKKERRERKEGKKGRKRTKKRKYMQAEKELLTSIKEKGPLGKKSPFARKEKVGQ